MDPITNPVDVVILQGKQSPGIAEVQGAGSPREWDERKQSYGSGARLAFKGKRLSHFKVLLRLFTPEDWADWNAWKHLVIDPPAPEGTEAERAIELQAGAAAEVSALTIAGQAAGHRLTPAQQTEIARARRTARPIDPNGPVSPAMDIQHPFLEERGIKSVVVEDCLQPVVDDTGIWTIEIHFIEQHRPVQTRQIISGSRDQTDAAPSANQITIAGLDASLTAADLAGGP